MPIIYLIQDNKKRDITSYISTITWSGGNRDVARKLEIGMLNSVLDSYTIDLYINNGSRLQLVEGSTTLFDGFVFFNERAGKMSTVYVTAYDRLVYLLKSKEVYNFKNTTAEAITRRICNQFQLSIGDVVETGVNVEFIANNRSLYDIIMQAYTSASKVTGKKYMLTMTNNQLNVIEIGSRVCTLLLSDDSNITDSGYSETIESMINRVKIYDDKQKYIGVVENAEWVSQYGVLQDIYIKQKDKNAQIEAKAILEGIKKDLSIEAIGNIECLSGNAVQVRDSLTGTTGLFYIESDTHTWSNSQHIMRLKLAFEKIMDERS